MRFFSYALCTGAVLLTAYGVVAKPAQQNTSEAPVDPAADTKHIEITADQSLEWYQDTHLYVARGNAKAVRGDMTVYADILSAHQRETPPKAGGDKEPAAAKPAVKDKSESGTGDIDKMTAQGNVRITTSKATVTGDHGIYDVNGHVAYLTGDHLQYKTDQETVTAKKSLEYWEDKKIAVARGDAVADHGDRHVEADVLTAEFRDMPNGKSQLQTMTAEGHVIVKTANDVSRGNRAVYDINRNIAVLTGNVRITRSDGTQLTGDVGESDFAKGQSRLLNEGSGRVRILLTSKSGDKADNTKPSKTAAKK